MNLLSDVIRYVRRIIKTPSSTAISDADIIDYINRFWITDVDARMQLVDLKTTYRFQTVPGVDQYNMPLYGVNNYLVQYEPTKAGGTTDFSYYPVYQGLIPPVYVKGLQIEYYNSRETFLKGWPVPVQALTNSYQGDGTAGPYTFALPYYPCLRGHVDITGVILAAGGTFQANDPITGTSPSTAVPLANVDSQVFVTATDTYNAPMVIQDSGQFHSSDQNLGFLIGDTDGTYSTTSNVVNYSTGEVYVTFGRAVPTSTAINLQCRWIQQGLPRCALFFGNTITLRPPPDVAYLVEIEGTLSPSSFMTTSQALPFAYMSEYLARGAARKILSDNADIEQFMFYEGLFRESEMLVWKRSQRIQTATRLETIFSQPFPQSTTNGCGGI